MDAAFWALLGQRGPWVAIIGALLVLLAAFVRAVLTGRLVPRSVLEDVRQDRDARIREMAEERDGWKAAHEVSEETRTIMARQVERLLSTSELTNQLLISLKSGGDKT
jgi:hypothetical protein